MITAEEFVVKIKANIKEAEKQITQLKKQLADTETVDIGKNGKGKKSFAEYIKQARAQKKAQKELKQAEQQAGTESQKSTNASIASMGKFAVVAGVALKAVKAVTSAMQEGLSNAYQFSKATGGGLASTLDRLSSKAEAIRNAFGSILASFAQKIEPILSNILDSLFDLISKASKFIAQLMGNSTYLKANKDIMKQWDKNVKQSRQLLSMDELHIMQQQDTAPENLFQEVALDPTESKLSGILEVFDKLKTVVTNLINSFKKFFEGETFQKIKSSLSQLGSALGGLLNNVLDFLAQVFQSQAWQNFLDFIGKVFNLVVSVGTVVVKFISDLFSWLSGKMTFKEVLTNLGNNIVNILSEPAKELWSTIKSWFIDVFDNVYVWVHNKLHPINKIEHSGMWYDNHPEVRSALLAQSAKPQTSPYATPDIPNMTEAEKRKLLEDWANRGFQGWHANGGVFNTPSIIGVGEYSSARYNPEIVTPENVLQANLDANNVNLISAFSQLTKQVIQAIGDVNMNVSISDTVVAQASAKGADQYYKLTGKPLFN